jgi:predicted GH43/DUF377 family glycosyl hydrolase
MTKDERFQYIIEKLRLNDKVQFEELSRALTVSEDTIRRDIKELADAGIISKVKGGAQPKVIIPATYQERELYASPDKRIFAKTDSGKYADKWSKSGSIISTYKNGKAVATKINGKYWMYWGDTQIWTATSEDLINWTPVKMLPGEKPPVKLRAEALNTPELKIALPTREGKFDSDLVEPGPPAILTDKGIVLIYNSRNVPSFGDKTLAEGTYAAGQALFDKNDPTKLLKRLDTYFMKPEKPYEISGQVNKVCFVEGLTIFENKWYLYYGTADSKIAVAVNPVK